MRNIFTSTFVWEEVSGRISLKIESSDGILLGIIDLRELIESGSFYMVGYSNGRDRHRICISPDLQWDIFSSADKEGKKDVKFYNEASKSYNSFILKSSYLDRRFKRSR